MLPKIIIIDNNIIRRETIRTVFKDQAEIYTTNISNEILNPRGIRTDIKQVDIMLIHAGDHHLEDLISTHLHIWYAGNHKNIKARIPAKNHNDLHINRSINAQEDALTPQETQQLIDYYHQKIPLPDFLFDPSNTLEDTVHEIVTYLVKNAAKKIELNIPQDHASPYPKLLELWHSYESQIQNTLDTNGFIINREAFDKAIKAFSEEAYLLK